MTVYCVHCYRYRPEEGGRYEAILKPYTQDIEREFFVCAECIPEVDQEREAVRRYREFHTEAPLHPEAA